MQRRVLLSAVIIAIICLAFYLWFYAPRKDLLDRVASDLDRLISTDRIGKQMIMLASKPHRAGTAENERVGRAILQKLNTLGMAVSTAEYLVNLHEPLESRLALVSPVSRKFPLSEKILPEDPFSLTATDQIPFFAYTPDFDIEAEVVYANFGTQEDYEILRRRGIDLAGKIALVRAQGICRSMKSLIAEQEGIVGLLLYPELRDQGFIKPAYPEGPHMNPWVIQRGTMLKYFLYPGDTLKPELQELQATKPKIAALPISEEVATEIFKHLRGEPISKDWAGWLPVTYATGPGPARIRMFFRGSWKQRKIKNIFATIEGSNKFEPSIMAGCHYDAWVYGASDPASGTAAILEVAESLATLNKKWWKPKRNLTFAFWDAEEYGLLGSASWVEQHISEVSKNLAAYVNVDSAVRTHELIANVMPTLQNSLDEALTRVKEPSIQRPLSDIRGEFQLPGFTSDISPFIGFTGTPVAEIGFGRTYSMYHSVYDNLYWLTKFADPGYRYTATLSKVLGIYLAKLSSSDILPYQFSELPDYVSRTLESVQFVDYENQGEGQGQFKLLQEEIGDFRVAAIQWQEALKNTGHLSDQQRQTVNSILLNIVRSFTADLEDNQKAHSYAKNNLLLGPSEVEGCTGEALPGLQKALRSRDNSKMTLEAGRLARAFSAASRQLIAAKELIHQQK